MSMRKVWIVEVKFAPSLGSRGSREWEPTVGVDLSKEGAEIKMLDWKRNCPDEKFKVTQYIPAEYCP
jgi:hypothetical protein